MDTSTFLKKLYDKIQPPTHTQLPDEYKRNTDILTTGLPPPIHPQDVDQRKILTWEPTPFHKEETLPSFVTGSAALDYFRVLRDVLYKLFRAYSHRGVITHFVTQGDLPRGLKINNNSNVVEQSNLLRLELLQIRSAAERKIVEAIMKHYDQLIPRLQDDFNKMWTAMAEVTEDEARLLALKLTHYKNQQFEQHLDKLGKKPKNPPAGGSRNPPETEDSDDDNNTPAPQPQRQAPRRGRGGGGRSRGRGRGRETRRM